MSNAEEISNLRKAIQDIRKRFNSDWRNKLEERKLKELEFHDRDRDRKTRQVAQQDSDTYEKFYGNKKYYVATASSRDYTQNWIKKNAVGKIFLDYACGDGAYAILAAKEGASLSIGMDISPVSVENAALDATRQNVSTNTEFFQGDCENTGLPDNSIDTIICSGMLHHLDLSYAFPELRRILKSGGKVLAVEALDYNPAIKLYRLMTPSMRTEWEKQHILSLKDIEFSKRFFDLGEVKYWHIVGIAAAKLPWLSSVLHATDAVLTKVPFVKLMAWIFTFELRKP
jgi:ubiquinone/menaquinone biosynthesis C-methylase UbiE